MPQTPAPKSPRHYPVYPFDRQPERAPSPVRLSSIVLAKEPPLEIKTQDEVIEQPEPQPEVQPPKKIKTILSTQKRKDSAPSLTGWRNDSDSDTDAQNRLLAKASGSIPIEYISIRRDPKPLDKKAEKKKSITTGTNTCTDRGKRIASTNTNQDELPQYNLHVSLDSLFVKSRREASTSTDRQNRNVGTETEIRQRDAYTVTDDEPEPEPEPPQQYCFKTRKSRYTEWETQSQPEEYYRLELLAKSPRTVRRRVVQQTTTQKQHYESEPDDDDRLIFGNFISTSQHHRTHHHHHHAQSPTCQHTYFSKRSGSFPNIMVNTIHHQSPIITTTTTLNNNGSMTTTRKVSSSQASTSGHHHHLHHHVSPFPPAPFFPQLVSTEMSLMPLASNTSCCNSSSNLFVNNEQLATSSSSSSALNHQASMFSRRFNEVFNIQPAAPKTERYYKYTRTTENRPPVIVPTFGEIYRCQHQQQQSLSSSANRQCDYSSCRSQQQQQYRSPIVEIPATPDSTMGNRNQQRFFSSNSSTCRGGSTHGLNQTASYGVNNMNNGHTASSYSQTISNQVPILTPLTPLAQPSNYFGTKSSGYSSACGGGAGGFTSASSCTSTMQRAFEPVVMQKQSKQSNNFSSQTQTTRTTTDEFELPEEEQVLESRVFFKPPPKIHGSNREEEEEELFNVIPPKGGAAATAAEDRHQFRPIASESGAAGAFTSTRSTPIQVINSSRSGGAANYSAGNRASQNHNNSFDYSSNSQNMNNHMHHYSTQSVGN